MRGQDARQEAMFSYVRLEERVPADHPLRRVLVMTDEALKALDGHFARLYPPAGRESIPPERLLRALLLQAFYSIRSERQLMERLEFDLLFRWFVGLGMDDPIWDATVFTKNRDRLLEGEVAQAFFDQVRDQARAEGLLSSEHFTVDGTLIEAWFSTRASSAELSLPSRPPTIRATRQWTSTRRSAATPPFNPPPIPSPGSTSIPGTSRPSSATGTTC